MDPAEDDGNNNNQNNYNNYNNSNDNYNYNNNGNNNNQNQEDAAVLEVCERLYEDAGKCETNLNVYGVYPTTLACEFINGLKASGKSRISAAFSGAKKNITPQVLAGVFAASTLVFGGVSYYFHKKLQRQNVGLVHGEGNMA